MYMHKLSGYPVVTEYASIDPDKLSMTKIDSVTVVGEEWKKNDVENEEENNGDGTEITTYNIEYNFFGNFRKLHVMSPYMKCTGINIYDKMHSKKQFAYLYFDVAGDQQSPELSGFLKIFEHINELVTNTYKTKNISIRRANQSAIFNTYRASHRAPYRVYCKDTLLRAYINCHNSMHGLKSVIYIHQSKTKGGNVIKLNNNGDAEFVANNLVKQCPILQRINGTLVADKNNTDKDVYYMGKFVVQFVVQVIHMLCNNVVCYKIMPIIKEIEIQNNFNKDASVVSSGMLPVTQQNMQIKQLVI